MKVALLFSGQIRDYYNYIENNYKYIIDPLKPDIFMSLWDLKLDNHEVEDCIKQYQPMVTKIIDKKINNILEKNSKLKNTCYVLVHRIIGQLYQINQCSLLKQEYEKINNFKYDVVIRHRLDLNIKDNVSQYIKLLDENTIIVPTGGDHVGGLNDTFAFGPSVMMDTYMDLYNHMEVLNCLLPFHAERSLRQWLININKIRILRVFLPTQFRERSVGDEIPDNKLFFEDNNLAKAF